MILLFKIIFFSLYSIAGEWDWGGQSVLRSYPVGALLGGHLGWGHKFWEKDKGDSQNEPTTPNPWYGYFRFSVGAQSSGVVNGFKTEMDFFPLSFLGVTVGHDLTSRDFEIGGFNCTIESCSGTIKRNYIGLKAALKKSLLSLLWESKYTKSEFNRHDRPFVDERNTLLHHGRGDRLWSHQSLLMLDVHEHWQGGILAATNKTKELPNKTSFLYGITRFHYDEWALLWGNGIFENRFSKRIFSTFIGLTWNGQQGVRLF